MRWVILVNIWRIQMLDKIAELIAKLFNRIIILTTNIRDFILALMGKMEYAAIC